MPFFLLFLEINALQGRDSRIGVSLRGGVCAGGYCNSPFVFDNPTQMGFPLKQKAFGGPGVCSIYTWGSDSDCLCCECYIL